MCSVRKVEPERPWNRMMYFPTSDMGAEWTGENCAWKGELWNYSRQIRSCKISNAIFRAVSGLSLTIFPDLPSRLPIKEAGATFLAIPPKNAPFSKTGADSEKARHSRESEGRAFSRPLRTGKVTGPDPAAASWQFQFFQQSIATNPDNRGPQRHDRL